MGRWSKLPVFESTISNLPPPLELRDGAKLSFLGNRFRINQNFDGKSKLQYQSCYNTKFYAPIHFNSNVKNEQQALWHRVLKKTPEPTGLMDHFILWVKQNLDFLLPKKKIRSDTIEVYLANSNAAPGVKRVVRRVSGQLTEKGISQTTSLGSDILYRYTARKSFVKDENLCYQSEGGCKEKAPRLIQGATPEFISLVGPWFSSFQRYMKRMWNKDNFLYFTSGATNVTMGEFFFQVSGMEYV